MSHSSESDSVADRNRSKRDPDRDRRSDRDRDRHRDRDRERDARDRGDRDRDRNREERRGRDREHRERSSEDHDRHNRHSRDQYEQIDELEDSRGSDDWPGRRHSSQDSRGRWNDSIPNNIILVRGLPAEAVESDVVSELLKTGTVVKDVRLMRSKDTGYSLRYCFVEFHTLAEAQYWMELNEGELMFWEKYPLNMYYSYSRRGNLNNTVSLPATDAALADASSDWTCIKCSCKNFQRRIFCRRCNHSRLESERVTVSDGLDQVGSNPCNTLILRGLDGLTTAENITAAFANLTSMPLKNVRVIHDRATGVSNGFAFVELNSLKESQDLLEYLETLPNPLEVDGKALLVAYAKNTFSTALATLDQSYATQNVDYSQQKSGAFYDYGSYYNYSAPTADSTNAAEVAQAAILASQQKKYKTNPTVVVAAPVLHNSQQMAPVVAVAQDYQQYPIPDVSTYQYDETSGYYYDASTGLYYDANSQYYYNSQTQQYLYWDGEKHTYLPAPTTSADTTDATAANDQKKEKSTDCDSALIPLLCVHE